MSVALRLGLTLLAVAVGGLALLVGVVATLVLLASLALMRELRS
jgi:hypothetical protein